MEDRELLRRYADAADEAAFTELVQRHGRWVFSAARRQLGDAHLAEDVTQATFLLLAQRAKQLTRYTYLNGWLFITLSFCLRHAKRQRARTQRREQEAATMRSERVTEPDWDDVGPLLETLVGRLGKADRDALLLRFYEQKPLAEVGRAMGVSEEASRKRVDRAVEKLRGMLERQGLASTSAGLSAVLLGNVVQEVPSSVVESVMGAVNGGGVGTAVVIVKGAIDTMTWAKLKVAGVFAAVVLGGVGVAVLHRSNGVLAGTGIEARKTMAESPATTNVSAATRPTANATTTELDVRPGDGVGPIKLGMEMAEVERLLGEPTRRSSTSGTIEYVHLGMVVIPRQGTTQVRAIVGERPIELQAFTGRTSEGLGIGSTREQIKATYGEPDRYTPAQGSFENLRYDRRGISFTLKDNQCMQLAVMAF